MRARAIVRLIVLLVLAWLMMLTLGYLLVRLGPWVLLGIPFPLWISWLAVRAPKSQPESVDGRVVDRELY